jgi:hypothetical protein
MRILKTFALAAAVIAVAAMLVPAQAQCGAAKQVTTAGPDGTSFIWMEDFPPNYYSGYPPYSTDGTPPITPSFFGVYWQLGAGDVELGLGSDSGGFPATGTDDWVYYGTFAAYNMNFGAIMFTTWAALPSIDGCVENGTCECVLMTDQRNGVGYFGLLSGQADPGTGNLFLNQGGADPAGNNTPIVMAPIPGPTITRIDMDMDTHNLTFNVTAAAPAAGVYQMDGCDCGPVGFNVYQAIVDRDAPPPGDRNAAGWEKMTALPVAFGAPAVFESACGGSEVDVYLAIGIEAADGFSGGTYPVILSENSAKTMCGPTMAQPTDLQPKIRRQLRDQPRTDRKR